MKSLPRCLALWAVLAGVAWLLLQPETARTIGVVMGLLRLVSFSVAVVLTWIAMKALPRGRVWRCLFWTVSLAGWLSVILLAQGRFESRVHSDDRQVLVMGAVGAMLIAGWIAARTRTLPSWRTLREGAAAFAILALGAAGCYFVYEAKTRSIQARAELRWAELGMPIDDVEKRLAPVLESPGSQVVREAFREILSQRFYKEGTAAAEKEAPIQKSEAAWALVTRAGEIITTKQPPSDELNAAKLPTAFLEPHSEQLDAAFRRILATEPPVWACNPSDGPLISVPNFLGLRMFSQLASAECLRRLAAGDQEGAARAIAASRRIGEKLESNPALVSLMFHVAVEAMWARQQARIEKSGDSMESIARDTLKWREYLVRTLQWESWMMLRKVDHFTSEEVRANLAVTSQFRYLPEWVRPVVDRAWLRRDGALSALNNAEHAAVRQMPGTYVSPDFGADLDEAISKRNPSTHDLGCTRAAMRIHATLLLREQAELIRDARARLAAGRPVESRSSVVLPSVRWEMNADPVKRTVAMKLRNAPKWVRDGTVTGGGDDFWILPLDGSVAWHFHTSAKGTAAR